MIAIRCQMVTIVITFNLWLQYPDNIILQGYWLFPPQLASLLKYRSTIFLPNEIVYKETICKNAKKTIPEVVKTIEKKRASLPTQPLPSLCPACKLAAVSNMPTTSLPNHKVSINHTSYSTSSVIQRVLWGHTLSSSPSARGAALKAHLRGNVPSISCEQVAPITVCGRRRWPDASLHKSNGHVYSRTHPLKN